MFIFNPIMVDNYAAFFNCTPVGRATDPMMPPHTHTHTIKAIHLSWLGPELRVCFLVHRGLSGDFKLVSHLAPRDLHRRAAYSILESSFFIHHDGYHDLFVCL